METIVHMADNHHPSVDAHPSVDDKNAILPALKEHTKCIGGDYYNLGLVTRGTLEEPVEFTHQSVLGKDGKRPVWADPEDAREVDFNRRAIYGEIQFGPDGRPINPVGKTGMTGRGLLGKWGPNSAADPLFTRWKRDEHGRIVIDGTPVMEVAMVKRADTGEWALPGGMVDYGEQTSVAARREFGEEALAGKTPEEIAQIMAQLKEMMDNQGVILYQGYVDDPRNTDNAWMVTTCFWVHDKTGRVFDKFNLKGGDDATHAEWVAVHSSTFATLKMFASHRDWVIAAYDYAIEQYTHKFQKTRDTMATVFESNWAVCSAGFLRATNLTRADSGTILRECYEEGCKWLDTTNQIVKRCVISNRLLLDTYITGTVLVVQDQDRLEIELKQLGDRIARLIREYYV